MIGIIYAGVPVSRPGPEQRGSVALSSDSLALTDVAQQPLHAAWVPKAARSQGAAGLIVLVPVP